MAKPSTRAWLPALLWACASACSNGAPASGSHTGGAGGASTSSTATGSGGASGTSTGGTTTTTTGSDGGVPGPTTSRHYTAGANVDASGHYTPGAVGFNLADVSSVSEVDALPAGVTGLVYLGLCNGADAAFVAAVTPYVGHAKVFGFYLMDEPDPTGKWKTACAPADLKAESDWIHAHLPGARTFVVMMNLGSSASPTFQGTYNPASTGIDLYGIDPYPCRTELSACALSWIPSAVTAAVASGIPLGSIVPVYQTFGGGAWVDDGGGAYQLPTAADELGILGAWRAAVPSPVFDYAYAWGSQNGDTALSGSPELQQVFAAHNQ